MKFSIITVCYNSKETILSAIESVFFQTYGDLEYIVVDGNSSDGTKEILRKEQERFSGRMKFISEPDQGIYFAMNKGLNLATGDVIGFLNSDDVLENSEVIAKYAQCFDRTQADAVFADLVYVEKNLEDISRIWKSGPLPERRMAWGWHPAHPTFYVKRDIYTKFGCFDTGYRIASDYDLMLRFIQKHKISCAYISECVVRMRVGGASNKNIKNILKANLECFQSWFKNKLSWNPIIILCKLAWKITQTQVLK